MEQSVALSLLTSLAALDLWPEDRVMTLSVSLTLMD